MKAIYKRVLQFVEFCPRCGERLQGNNSDWLPYKCSCGVWKWSWALSEFLIDGVREVVEYSGELHWSDCDFIYHDEGNCNCPKDLVKGAYDTSQG